MRVLKRNGKLEDVSFDKVLRRLSKLAQDISVDYFEIAKKVCSRIYDGVSTDLLDDLAANICSSLIVDNPDYDKLASRIAVSNHHKKTSWKFSETIEKLHAYDKNKLISDELYDIVKNNTEELNGHIDYEKDYDFDYFGFKTLEKSYLLSIDGQVIERPQDMWMRVSIAIHRDNIEKVLETYDCMSSKLFTHATPTLFNFGTKREQGSSCFVAGTPVYTVNRGPVPIENVEIGDKVITHTGSTKAVVQTHKNLLDGRQLFEVKVNETPAFRVTGNHRLFSITNEQLSWKESPQWNSIEHLRIGDWIAIPKSSNKATFHEKIEIEGNIFLRIHSKSKVNDDLPKHVYTLGVEDDHSYAISGLIAENCFLVNMQEDSVSGMYNTLQDCALISKFAGGIGLHIHNVRANGSLIRGTNGKSTGIVPMLRVYNDAARHINQAGKRNGSFAIYIEPWHADIEAFLDLKKNHGVESERARDLFYALWIPNIFMQRVQQNGKWSLMCPDQCPGLSDAFDDGDSKMFTELYERYEEAGKFVKQVDAQDIWIKILEAQIETGTPYMLYKDHVNSKSNHKNLGTIKSSNLCVSPETRILTREGYRYIGDLEDTTVEVFNGTEFSETTVFKTGTNQKLLSVRTQDGHMLRCTHDHEFFIEEDGKERKVKASDLQGGMRLASHRLPVIKDDAGMLTMKYAYTHGFLCGNLSGKSRNAQSRCKLGVVKNYTCSLHQGRSREFLLNDDICQAYEFDEQKTLLVHKDDRNLLSRLEYDCEQEYESEYVRIALPRDIEEKYYVPIMHVFRERIEWISGLLNSGGKVDKSTGDIYVYNSDVSFMRDVCLLVQTLGAKAVLVDDAIKFDIVAIFALKNVGVKTVHSTPVPEFERISEPHHDKIDEVFDYGEITDTYCFTEKLRNKGIFNGILTSQCSEIVQYTSPDEIAVCNLASVCLPSFVDEETKSFDYDKLHYIVGIMTVNLNRIIDLNFYPVEKARISNMRHRPIGIGVQGLADVFFKLGIAYDSEEAKVLNERIFENIYYAALKASCQLAEEEGAYETFVGSPASRGVLQHDMWSTDASALTCDWDGLKNNISKYGLRNSLVCAPMPTASTSQICGNTESFEPVHSNIFKRKTLAGEFIIVNKHLVRELIKLKLWSKSMKDTIIASDGSIQGISEIPEEVRGRYKTVWEIKQKRVIDMAADRGKFIDQSQSMNLYQSDPTFPKITRMHFYAWEKGLKTGMYYLRTRAKAAIQKFSLDNSMSRTNYETSSEPCENCSA